MDLGKRLLLAAWYGGTLPLRRRIAADMARGGRAAVSVLFYHRVADRADNAWTMSAAGFARQVRWLRRHYRIVSLDEAQSRLRNGSDEPTVAITFDDGYADNWRTAVPLLLDAGVPFTYFVTLANLVSGEPFAHDVAHGRPLPPNTVEQLRAMAAVGVEIGAHAYTHRDLGGLIDSAALEREIAAPKEELARLVGRPVRYFAFPFGLRHNLSAAAFAAARRAGYAGVCSAYGGYNLPGDDPFHLQRIHADEELLRLKNWLSLDPRKLGRRQFDAPAADQATLEPAYQAG